ncbi:MAG: type II CAAX prenyl endopeptidase Rce1 family protein [Patescibacteria group bacterium]
MKFFQNLSQKSNSKFILYLTLIAFLGKLPVLIVSDTLFHLVGLGALVELLEYAQVPEITSTDFVLGVLVAPFIETIIGQWIPINLIGIFFKQDKLKIIGSALVFMLIHFPAVTFFPAAFFVGLLFSWAWLQKRKVSLSKAFWTVTFIHALHNLLAFGVTFVADSYNIF